MKKVYSRPECLKDTIYHFCPGCNHGNVTRMVAEAIDEFGIKGRTIGVAGVGCCVFLYNYIDVDVMEAPHGRACAVATGINRVHPEKIVFTYQGDGDLAAIGLAETVHTANRGENITVIFVNNTVYGMTGGQMAPTTLLGQKSTTSPYGREFMGDGYPIKMAEMLATLEGAAFVARVACDTPKNLMQAKKAIKKAFKMQIDKMGFSFVEVLSACPTNWGMNPLDAYKRVDREMTPYFPLGIFKERTTADYL
ncbi:MAG TPA: thiamine pyrophosphate-dependent enzyme [bacterium]|nr:thiamine pyrophosphate-dependent enzyme [bacterium]